MIRSLGTILEIILPKSSSFLLFFHCLHFRLHFLSLVIMLCGDSDFLKFRTNASFSSLENILTVLSKLEKHMPFDQATPQKNTTLSYLPINFIQAIKFNLCSCPNAFMSHRHPGIIYVGT